ncbi:unnamed protein product [Closterium sp. NIES-54]
MSSPASPVPLPSKSFTLSSLAFCLPLPFFFPSPSPSLPPSIPTSSFISLSRLSSALRPSHHNHFTHSIVTATVRVTLYRTFTNCAQFYIWVSLSHTAICPYPLLPTFPHQSLTPHLLHQYSHLLPFDCPLPPPLPSCSFFPPPLRPPPPPLSPPTRLLHQT